MVRSEAPLVERMTLVWHDWFATEQRGPSHTPDAAPERAAAPPCARRRSSTSSLGVTRDPAMLLWLNGDQQHPLERRTRTTRASCRSCSRSAPTAATASATCASWRARSPASAATGRDGDGAPRLPLRPGARTTRASSACTAGAAATTGSDAARLRGPATAQHPSFLVAKLWGYFIPTPPPAATARALERLYTRAAARSARSSTRSCATRTSTTRTAAWSSRRSSRRPACCAPSAAAIDTTAWAWLCDDARPDAVRAAERRRLGRHALARHRDLPRPLEAATGRSSRTARPRPGERPPRRRAAEPAAAVDGALRFWGDPPLTRDDPRGLERYAATRWRPPSRGSTSPTRAAPERPAHADRHLPRPADDADVPRPPRLRDRPRTAPRRLRPARDRARHARRPRAPACRAARCCCARPGSRWPSTAPRARACRRSRRASPRAAAGPAAASS